jgi:predicted enzyme related to lactoylglutathione lyase
MNSLISGAHVLIYSRDAEADRAFFKNVLDLDSVDSGGGWLIFALPPAEVAIHPAQETEDHVLYLLCEDIEATARALEQKGVSLKRPFDEPRWGRVTELSLPSGTRIGLYQPKHPLAHSKTEPRERSAGSRQR